MVASYDSFAPLIVVVGATGAQGGSVIDNIIRSKKEYRIRAITRDPSKANAQSLTKRGAEVVQGDLASYDSIKSAINGAHYVFGVTNYFEGMDSDKEIQEGKLLVDTCKQANVKLFIWSGLESSFEISGGKRNVTHFETKASVTKYAKEQGIPLSVVKAGFYMSNLTTLLTPRKQGDGSFTLALPIKASTKVPAIWAVKDYGAYVIEAIEGPSFGPASEILAVNEYITFSEIVSKISAASGKTVNFVEVSVAEFEKILPYIGSELVKMFKFFEEYGYFGGKEIASSQAELPFPTHSFEQFAQATDWSKVLV